MTFTIRPDQINLLLLGFSESKIGPTDRNKNINLMGVAIDHNLIYQLATRIHVRIASFTK